MLSALPAGSQITVLEQDGTYTISIPHKKAGKKRYLLILAMLYGFFIWHIGVKLALGILLTVDADQYQLFVLFALLWLILSIYGAVVMVLIFYRMLRSPTPETISLTRQSMFHDPGLKQLILADLQTSSNNIWRRIFPKRARQEFGPDEFASLYLRETDKCNRLTIDKGTMRIELGKSASETEREWLYAYLTDIFR